MHRNNSERIKKSAEQQLTRVIINIRIKIIQYESP